MTWEKLKRVVIYICVTINLPLVLKEDSINVVKWWVDGSFGVRPDVRRHPGGIMLL